MIKCVIFDIGGVIIDFDWRERLRKLIKRAGKKLNEVHFREGMLMGKYELGLIKVNYFEKELARYLGIKKSDIRWLEYYRKHARLNPDMIDVVTKLKEEGYIVAFISNTIIDEYEEAEKLLDFSLFDYRFASCYIKLRKPDPEIFKYALKKMKLKPSEAVFIDNQIENVLSARSVGIKSYWFRGIEGFTKQLSRWNIL